MTPPKGTRRDGAPQPDSDPTADASSEQTISVADGPPVPGLTDGHIDRYIVRGAVGAGGMGLVVAAYDPELDRRVAIKLVATEREESRARLVREAQAMARLSHPNVVTVHEVVWIGARAGIVMELVEGKDLAAWRDAGSHGWREAVELYVQAARGLAAAHRAGIVHRDFKPSNALLGNDGVVRVTDFGLARSFGPSDVAPPPVEAAPPSGPSALGDALTRTGVVVGTPAYMAPEQHLGGTVDARTDQWALACSLYEAIYGERPFDGDGPETLRTRVLAGDVRPARAEVRVPRALRAALLRALAPRPEDRFADMDAFIGALVAPGRRASRLAAGALVGLAVAAMAVGVAVLRRAPSGRAPSCVGLDAPLTAEWNAKRADQLRRHLLAGGRTAADVARLIGSLDQFGKSWAAARANACMQTRQGVRSQAELDRRMRCLDERLVELSSLVGGLTEGDARTVSAAGDAIDGLHPVADCDDPRESVPLPASRAARDQIAEAQRLLARAWAAAELSQYERARGLAQRAADVGRSTGWGPLEAEALLVVGNCQQRHRDFQDALATLNRAASVAAAAKDDTALAQALAARFLLLDENLGRPAEALDGRTYVELALVRAGQPPRLRARWLHYLAVALHGQGREDEALADEQEAIATLRKLVAPNSAALLDSLETEANIQIARKQLAAAEPLLREVLAGRIAARGPDDPGVGAAEDNLGVLEFSRYNLERAIEHWERAARISDRSGTLNWRVYSNLGAARTELGRLHAALADFERARTMVEREAPGDSSYLGECLGSIGIILTQLGQLDRAAPLLDRSLAAARQSKSPSALSLALVSEAKLALGRGDVAGAAARLRELVHVDPDANDPMRAILAAEVKRAQSGCGAARGAIKEALVAIADDPYQSERMEARLVSAQCHVELGQPAAAIGELEPDLAWLEAHHADPEAMAAARLALAQALTAKGGDGARARTLAAQALPALFGREHDEAARWIARNLR